jgi:patatin-like phospholipase/acyl hydrolase
MLKRLASHAPQVVSNADMLAGTSIGSGVVSLLLANNSPAEVYRSLLSGAPKFFAHPSSAATKPAFDIEKDVAAQRALHPSNPPLSRLHKLVLLTSFNVGGAGRPWQPLLFNNMPGSSTADTRLVDAVVSSQAMPGELGSHHGNIDGAFVNHDPTLAAVALAVDAGVRLEDIVVICFGTGFMANWIASDTSMWGARQWQNGDGNPSSRTSTLINGTISPVLAAALDGPSVNLTPQLAGMLLGQRYAYLNPTLDRLIPEDDTNPRDLAYLKAQAAQVNISAAVRLVRKYWS